MREMDLTNGEISAIFSLATWCGAIVQIPAGRAVDRFGARSCMVVAAVILSGGQVLFATARHPAQLFFAYFILRSAFAVDTFADTCLTQWFDVYRGRAVAFCQIGQAVIGGMGFTLLAQYWCNTLGWRTAYVYAAAMVGFWAVPTAIFIRSSPEAMGLSPDGQGEGKDDGGGGVGMLALTTVEGERGTGAEEREVEGEEEEAETRALAELGEKAEEETTPSSPREWTVEEACYTRALWLVCVHSFVDGINGAGTNLHRISIISEAI